jgi:hypothetical protein
VRLTLGTIFVRDPVCIGCIAVKGVAPRAVIGVGSVTFPIEPLLLEVNALLNSANNPPVPLAFELVRNRTNKTKNRRAFAIGLKPGIYPRAPMIQRDAIQTRKLPDALVETKSDFNSVNRPGVLPLSVSVPRTAAIRKRAPIAMNATGISQPHNC